MNKTWQLQDAKSRFSELVERAKQGDVQLVTKRGKKAAVLIGYEQYLALTRQDATLLDTLRGEPPYFDELPFKRDKDLGRELTLK